VRDGDWMFIESYDGAPDELYDLANDIGERNNVAPKNPERVSALKAALDKWRRDVHAQGNRPNPMFNPALFRQLYEDFDPSRFDPPKATAADWETIQQWRTGMNTAPSTGSQPTPGKGKKARP